MRLHTVTASGIDDTVSPERLLELQRQFPFVEFGILLSQSNQGTPRYPTTVWIDRLRTLACDSVHLSGHLCGRWARDVCRGSFPPDVDVTPFGRIQLNIAPHMQLIETPEAMATCLPAGREYILQVGQSVDAGLTLARELKGAGATVSVLFDSSGGRGITPDQWPSLPIDLMCGFAGGFGPENLKTQLERLAIIAENRVIWIDMESKIRSDSDEFDLDKVRRCLEIARCYWS